MQIGKIRLFIEDCTQYIIYLRNKRISNKQWGICKFPYRKQSKALKVNVLANGPSLSLELKEALSHKDRLNAVCNFAAFSDYFQEIKPEFYFLADPAFFEQVETNEKIKQLIDILNKQVHWNITLVVPINGYQVALKNIANESIDIVSVPISQYKGNSNKRLELIKKGDCAPSYVNVTIFAEYFFLNMGYKILFLYGVDHSFFDNMFINSKNEICMNDNHFYGKEPIVIKRYKSDGTQWKLSDWLRDKYLTFLEHERMQEYAEYVGAKIINCTEKSLIDAYPRLSQFEKR